MKTMKIPMRNLRIWCLALSLCAATSSCAQVVSGGWGKSPPPAGTGLACQPSAATGKPTTTQNMSSMKEAEPDGCIAAWSCNASPCVFEMPSLTIYKNNTILSFSCDLKSNDNTGTPAAANNSWSAVATLASTDPRPTPGYNTVDLCITPAKFWGTGSIPKTCMPFYLAGSKGYVRINMEHGVQVPADSGGSGLIATITMNKDTKVGSQCGWRQL